MTRTVILALDGQSYRFDKETILRRIAVFATAAADEDITIRPGTGSGNEVMNISVGSVTGAQITAVLELEQKIPAGTILYADSVSTGYAHLIFDA